MSREKTVSARFAYMDVLRIIGCILVMWLHMATLDDKFFSVAGVEWKVMNFMDSIGMTGIAFFYMISGALFLRKDSKLTNRYVWKKVGMLFVVYVVSLIIYNIIPFVRGWEPWEWYYISIDLIGNVLKGIGIYHLWFPPSLMMLYLLSPILKDAFAEKKSCEYFLTLFAVFGVTIPLLLRLDIPYKDILQSIQFRFGQEWFLGHLGYFVLGHYLHEFVGKLDKKKSVLAVVTAIGTVAFTMVVNHADAVAKNGFSTKANSPLTLNGFLFVLCVFLLVKSWTPMELSEKKAKVLRYVAGLTFGIYLVHPLVMSQLMTLIPWNEVFGVFVVKVVVRFLFVLMMSALITAVLKCIPGVKRFL